MFTAQEITLTPSEFISTVNDAKVTEKHGKRLDSSCVSYSMNISKGENCHLLQDSFIYLALLTNVEKRGQLTDQIGLPCLFEPWWDHQASWIGFQVQESDPYICPDTSRDLVLTLLLRD